MDSRDSAPTQTDGLKHTPLHALHLELGAKLVPFAGYAMPLQYAHGIKHEHCATRARAGLFDVSHMGQISVHAPAAALEALVPSDIVGLADFQQRYTLFTNDAGGIIDDLMVTRLPGYFSLVVNAAFKAADLAYLQRQLGADHPIESHPDRALLALQGPAAASVLASLNPAIATLEFMTGREFSIDGSACLINRCGYTGEDGFEIAVAANAAEHLARRLLAHGQVEPVGLGARDSLRLEAGLCLSGADLDSTTSPVEAGLSWVIARKYVGATATPARFPGAPIILRQRREGTTRVRVGIRPTGRIPVRAGAALCTHEGTHVGTVTSGGFGPSLDVPIAMGYVEPACAAPGTLLTVTIRERVHTVEVTRLPFVPHRYHKPKA